MFAGPRLIALTGLSGVGKSTAVTWFVETHGAVRVYMGDVILEYRDVRGLSRDAEGERVARMELQALHGAGFAVARRAERIRAGLARQSTVVVDAAFRVAEVDHLADLACGVGFHLVAIEADFDVRCRRLVSRPLRPFSPSEVAARDRLELEEIGTGQVIDLASNRLRNDGSVPQFQDALSSFVESIK